MAADLRRPPPFCQAASMRPVVVQRGIGFLLGEYRLFLIPLARGLKPSTRVCPPRSRGSKPALPNSLRLCFSRPRCLNLPLAFSASTLSGPGRDRGPANRSGSPGFSFCKSFFFLHTLRREDEIFFLLIWFPVLSFRSSLFVVSRSLEKHAPLGPGSFSPSRRSEVHILARLPLLWRIVIRSFLFSPKTLSLAR